jgi:hypothetical protein
MVQAVQDVLCRQHHDQDVEITMGLVVEVWEEEEDFVDVEVVE